MTGAPPTFRGWSLGGARRWAGRLAMALLGLGVGLLLAEGSVRLLEDRQAHHLPANLIVIDSELGWRLNRDLDVRHHSRYFDVRYHTDARGFRDQPGRATTDATGKLRLLLQGDSQVFGWGTPVGERFSNLVEHRVPTVELWNRAVPGYGLDQQVLSYEQQSDESVDGVVLYLSEATLHRLRFSYRFGAYKPRFELDAANELRLVRPSRLPGRRILFWLPDWMVLPHALDRRLASLDERLRAGPSPGGWPGLGRPLLDRVRRRAVLHDHVVLLLSHLPASERSGVDELAADLGLHHVAIDLGSDAGRYRFGPKDHHWNRAGHVRVADQLATALRELVRSDLSNESSRDLLAVSSRTNPAADSLVAAPKRAVASSNGSL